jgi:phage regulator Rha-like protein
MTAELTLPKGGALPEGRVMVFEREGAVFANSRDVADYFGKRHDHVLRDIRHLVAEASPNWGGVLHASGNGAAEASML